MNLFFFCLIFLRYFYAFLIYFSYLASFYQWEKGKGGKVDFSIYLVLLEFLSLVFWELVLFVFKLIFSTFVHRNDFCWTELSFDIFISFRPVSYLFFSIWRRKNISKIIKNQNGRHLQVKKDLFGCNTIKKLARKKNQDQHSKMNNSPDKNDRNQEKVENGNIIRFSSTKIQLFLTSCLACWDKSVISYFRWTTLYLWIVCLSSDRVQVKKIYWKNILILRQYLPHCTKIMKRGFSTSTKYVLSLKMCFCFSDIWSRDSNPAAVPSLIFWP